MSKVLVKSKVHIEQRTTNISLPTNTQFKLLFILHLQILSLLFGFWAGFFGIEQHSTPSVARRALFAISHCVALVENVRSQEVDSVNKRLCSYHRDYIVIETLPGA